MHSSCQPENCSLSQNSRDPKLWLATWLQNKETGSRNIFSDNKRKENQHYEQRVGPITNSTKSNA